MKILYDNIQNEVHCWTVCCDLKIIPLLTGLQCSYTQFCCFFLCEWDSRMYLENNLITWRMDKIRVLTHAKENVGHPSLVRSEMILLPQLHLCLDFLMSF